MCAVKQSMHGWNTAQSNSQESLWSRNKNDGQDFPWLQLRLQHLRECHPLTVAPSHMQNPSGLSLSKLLDKIRDGKPAILSGEKLQTLW